MSAASRGGRGERGAVYVEFIIAFMPFFVFFLCLWQVSILYSTKIILDYAADNAARAAATIMGDDPANYDNTPAINTFAQSRIDRVRVAAELAAAPLIVDKTIVSLTLSFPGHDTNGTIPGMGTGSLVTQHMQARLEAKMNCKIAFANLILCKAEGIAGVPFSLSLTSQGDFPYMGASYGY